MSKFSYLFFFVVVGGGPTGVEFAAELNDFKEDLAKVFPIVKDHFKISLVQSASHILNSYSESISKCNPNFLMEINFSQRYRREIQ